MQGGRWNEIKQLYTSALERPPDERVPYLRQACSDDSLRKEVESLLAVGSDAAGFIESPAMDLAAQVLFRDRLADPPPALSGQRLLHYLVGEKIGAGGMGEVYRARDERLRRDVALKLLPDIFSRDPERRSRFNREAMLLASLNHPNIAAIHGLEECRGRPFLVLELIEGQTLAERLLNGPLAIQEALEVCSQIADGLEAAHEKGIVHRDLKPSNVKTMPDGRIKVLDFGLAKALADDGKSTDFSHPPDVIDRSTKSGMILGTAAYMSPEQAKGQPVDKRADIWAWGCLLFECLSGRRAFPGDTVSDTIASILLREPDWDLLPATTPGIVRRLLKRCLSKEPLQRLRDVADAAIEIREELNKGGESREESSVEFGRRRWLLPTVLITLPLIGVVATVISLRTEPPKRPANIRLTLESLVGTIVPGKSGASAASISPSGQHLAYLARVENGQRQIHVRSVDSLDTRVLSGTEGALDPFWCPDNRAIAFFSDRKLKRAEISGGAVQTICELPSTAGAGGSWNGKGILLFGPSEGPIYRVSAAGGAPLAVTKLDTTAGELRHVTPWFLPDGDHFLFLAVTRNRDKRAIWVASVKDGTRTIVTAENSNAAYAASHIFFSRDRVLMAQPFDIRSQRITGEALVVADGLAHNEVTGRSAFSVSTTGSILYTVGDEPVELVWLSPTGHVENVAAPPGEYWGYAVSADGRRVAVAKRAKDGTGDLWGFDRGQAASRITSNGGVLRGAVWSPDGKQVAFARFRFDASAALSVISSTGSDERLLADIGGVPTSWSPDGRWLAFSEFRIESGWNLMALDLSTGRTMPFLETAFSEWQGEFSPDGKWMAYVSNESAFREVYVRAFPDGKHKCKVSTAGGTSPAWSPNGDRLFYEANGALMSADVTIAGKELHAGNPLALFPLPPSRFAHDSGNAGGPLMGPGICVTRDGRFLVERSQQEKTGPTIAIILNWEPAGQPN